MDISPKDLRDHILKMASLVEASLSMSLNLEKSMEDIFELEKKLMNIICSLMMLALSTSL